MSDGSKNQRFWRTMFAVLADERLYLSPEEVRDRRIAALEAEVSALRARSDAALRGDPSGDRPG